MFFLIIFVSHIFKLIFQEVPLTLALKIFFHLLFRFALNSTTGAMYIKTPLDYDIIKSYGVITTAADTASPPIVNKVTTNVEIQLIDINDSPPLFRNIPTVVSVY